jgi:hypothetical protein
MSAISNIHRLFTRDPAKETALHDAIRRGRPLQVRSNLKLNHSLTKQLCFVHKGKIEVVSYPMLTTNEANEITIIGTWGDEIDNLAPIAIGGNVVNHSISVLVPGDLANQFDLPTLQVDPLGLHAPRLPGATEEATEDDDVDQERFHFVFNHIDKAPVIAAMTVAFPLEIGVKPPIGFDLVAGPITIADFPSEAGCLWANAMRHSLLHFNGTSIHDFAGMFKPNDLDLTTFSDHVMAETLEVENVDMLPPNGQHYKSVTEVTREAIQARQQLQASQQPNVPNNPSTETASLERQARVLTAIVEAASNKTNVVTPVQPTRAEKAADAQEKDTCVRYQLMFAKIVTAIDPNDPSVSVATVVLPQISNVFKEILGITKIALSCRAIKEQFLAHVQSMATSSNFYEMLVNFDVRSFDPALVTAILLANWLDRALAMEPKSVNDRAGIYHFASPRTESVAYQERDANNSKIYRQETVGEDKSRIAAKTYNLDHSGKLDTETDLHSTIANFFAIATFITKEAAESELAKSFKSLHGIWLHPDGKNWLSHHLRHCKYLVAAIIMQFQTVLGLYVKIANSMEYRQAVKSGKAISPLVYQNANTQAKHVMASLNNVVPTMTLGPFIYEQKECALFYDKDATPSPAAPAAPASTPGAASNEQRQSPARANQRNRSNHDQRGDNRSNGGTPSDARSNGTPPGSRGNNRSTTTPPELPQEELERLKLKGVVAWAGGPRARIPYPEGILEAHGDRGLVRICMPHITVGKACRWGNDCRSKHINNLRDFTAANKTTFQTYVTNQSQVTMATNGTN